MAKIKVERVPAGKKRLKNLRRLDETIATIVACLDDLDDQVDVALVLAAVNREVERFCGVSDADVKRAALMLSAQDRELCN